MDNDVKNLLTGLAAFILAVILLKTCADNHFKTSCYYTPEVPESNHSKKGIRKEEGRAADLIEEYMLYQGLY